MRELLKDLSAWCYDRAVSSQGERWLDERRAALLSDARGDTLEIGAGTGLNLDHYDERGVASLDLVEPDAAMRRRLARRRAQGHGPPARVHAAAAGNLPFPSDSFDTVVVTLVLCSVPDQRAALAEIRRVLRPDGRLLLMEHVRGEGSAARWQDRLSPVWSRMPHGCHVNRDTASALVEAGFRAERSERFRPPVRLGALLPHIAGVYAPSDLAALGGRPE